jgi:adenylate cyclase
VAQERATDITVGWRDAFRRRSRSFARLPARVQALVDADLQRADVLGAWIVFAVAAFLGALFLIAPKPRDAMMGVGPVPLVVGLFLILSVVRLRMAHRRPLSHMAQTVFTLADFTLLYGLIWTFHQHYGQPAAFYLKAPTFLFVFLLIAVRALRFDPLAVVTAGVTAALGWMILVAYALRNTPPPAVTRDFIAYMTDSLVLIGAEVEKIVAMLLVTGVLTLAILRGRRQLVLAASETTARDDLSRFFAPEVAARITHDDELLKPGFGEVRRGAILVTDIRDFTHFAAQRPANEVMALLVGYQKGISRVVTEHGGAIDKFLGDGILATFGCARHSATPAADALRALMKLVDRAGEFARDATGRPLACGFSLTSGNVLCGTVGEESRLEFTVIGDAVNRAVKLEKANKEVGTVALAEGEVVEAAEREGFAPSDLGSRERFDVQLPGVPEAYRVIGWRRKTAMTA